MPDLQAEKDDSEQRNHLGAGLENFFKYLAGDVVKDWHLVDRLGHARYNLPEYAAQCPGYVCFDCDGEGRPFLA